jgi:hypothetical protein
MFKCGDPRIPTAAGFGAVGINRPVELCHLNERAVRTPRIHDENLGDRSLARKSPHFSLAQSLSRHMGLRCAHPSSVPVRHILLSNGADPSSFGLPSIQDGSKSVGRSIEVVSAVAQLWLQTKSSSKGNFGGTCRLPAARSLQMPGSSDTKKS